MASKSEIYRSAAVVQSRIAELRDVIANDPELQRRGGVVFLHYTIGANLDPIFELLGKSGNEGLLTGTDVRYIADIGCGNGELSFMLSHCGYKVTALDYSDQHNQSPYIVSQLANKLSLPIAIVDFSVDKPFVMGDLQNSCISNNGIILPRQLQNFDFVICVGLLYHLKNPFAFIQSLAQITQYCILGTWMFTHLSPGLIDVEQNSLVYLLDDRELNADPTNYWVFSDAALSRLCRRCGFDLMDKLLVPNNEQGIGTPNRMELGLRGFYLLRSLINAR
jgi:tRNA (mo5U34)-methyltransferase